MAGNRILKSPGPIRVKREAPSCWSFSNGLARKDGYELYLRDSGFALNVRDPDEMGWETIVQVNVDSYSPHYVGAALYVLKHAELLAHEDQNRKP